MTTPKLSLSLFNCALLILFICWLVYAIEINFDLNFNKHGIYPGEWSGLLGVFFSPFIHGDAKHLLNNSMPLLVLFPLALYFYPFIRYRLLFLGILFSGLFTWFFGRPSYHIGLSGFIYVLFGFLTLSGLFRKQYRLIAVSFVVIFFYGQMLWYVFPVKEGISWEGHLGGFLVGCVYAFVYRDKKAIYKNDLPIEDEPIDFYFGKNGELIDLNPPEENVGEDL